MAESKPEAIFHFASHTLVGESVEKPFLYLGNNVQAGIHLLRAAADFGVRRFVLSSTANLFDQPEKVPIDETARIFPGSPYGESKRILESMLFWLDKTVGIRFACLRYFNACGATRTHGEDHAPETHLIPILLEVAFGKRSSFTVFGDDYPTPDGTCVRDYVHVADLASAHLLALEALGIGSKVYNLGNGQGFSVLEVVKAAEEVTGRKIPVVRGARRSGDPAVLVASSDKIRSELGWQPEYPDLRSIIDSAWQWMVQHPHGYPANPVFQSHGKVRSTIEASGG